MPRKKKNKKKNSKLAKAGTVGLGIGRWLLEAFLMMTELLPTIETPHEHLRRLGGYPKEFKCYRVNQEIKRMKDRGWIKEAEKQGKKFLKLTAKGKMRALYQKLQELDPEKKSKWNGYWWFALFDIPEKGKCERNKIRRLFNAVGFFRFQKSVYAYPYDIPAELYNYLREAKLLPYIHFVRVSHANNLDLMKRFFKL